MGYFRSYDAPVERLRSFEAEGFRAGLSRSVFAGPVLFHHREPDHLVFVTVAGGTRATIAEAEGTTAVARRDCPGAVTVVPADTRRQVTLADGDIMVATMTITQRFLQDAADADDVAPPRLLQNGRDDWLLRAARVFGDAMDMGGPRLLIDAIALAVARHLALNAGRPGRCSLGLDPAALRRVITLIHDRLAEDLSLGELAGEAGLSTSAFGRAFRRATGRTPFQYLTAIRMDRAKGLLTQRRMPLAAVAQATGYSDQAHFTAAFSRHVGLSPARWRAARAG